MAVADLGERGYLERLLDGLVPRDRDPEADARTRLFVKAWLPVFPFSLGAGAWFAWLGSWGMVAVLSAGLVVGVGVLAMIRFAGRARLAIHLACFAGSVLFPLSGLTQTPADPTAPTVLVIIPLSAAFLLGARAAWSWTVVCAVFAVGQLFLASRGVALPYPDESPVVTQALNYLYAMIVVVVLAQNADQMRTRVIEEQRKSARTKSRFLANISHEIRTPMNGVLGMTDELLTRSELPDDVVDRLGVIQRSGQEMVALINDLLDLTKIEAGKLSLSSQATNLHQLVSDVAALFEPLAVRKGLTLEVLRGDDVPPWVVIDGQRLKQVLANLVSNAVKFTDEGKVTFELRRMGETPCRVRFSVGDTGPGISPEVLPRLFTVFEQGDASTTRKHGGSGLGLALSKQLVGLLGGELTVQSVVGVGSTFGFELTMGVTERPVVTTPSPLPRQLLQTVLVVDDNPINRRVAEALLLRAGYQVESVANGREALERLAHTPVSAVLMDCHMPVMDGFETTERIRRLDTPLSRTPVIALTASASSEDREACQRAGMNACLVKPVSFEELVSTLAAVTRAR